MTTQRIQQDLDYVATAVRRHDQPLGVPAIYFLWAVLVPVGFALPDFAPRIAGPYWLVAGFGGGLLSWWLGARDARRTGINDTTDGWRHGLHWLVGGLGFLLCTLPGIVGRIPFSEAVPNFLLVAGLVYALAGVHLERPLLWSGLVMLAAFAVLTVFALPYTWTMTGVAIGLSLAWAGWSAQRAAATDPA
ncbi:hypothetical protein [Lysobacter sp. A3-1-A15]|uniref:hypothetical protein n=1 Tax=Novilysobacter viscosus TaxID=3098602 RepID=UPI002ED902A1